MNAGESPGLLAEKVAGSEPATTELKEVSSSTNTVQNGGRQERRKLEREQRKLLRLVEEATGFPFSLLFPDGVADSPESGKAETKNGTGSHEELDLVQVRRKLHSIDIQPDSDRASHLLVVNGHVAARFASLATALQVREEMISDATNNESSNS